MGVTHLLIGDLQQVQHCSVGPHILKQPLLLHTTLLTGIAQLTESKKDLNIGHTHLLHTHSHKETTESDLEMISCGTHLFNNVIVVCFVAVNLRFILSILYWAQNTLLAGESNTIFINVIKANDILNILIAGV